MAIPYAWLIKAAVLLAAIYVASQATIAFIPIGIALALAFILHPLVRFLSRARLWPLKRPLGATTAILLSFVVAVIVVAFIVNVLLTPIVHEFNRLMANMPQIMRAIEEQAVRFYNEILQPAIANSMNENQSEQLNNLFQQALSSGASFSINLIKNAANLSLNVVTRIIDLIVVPVLLFYFLKDWPNIVDGVLRLFTPGARRRARVIIYEMGAVISDYIRGQFLLCLLVGLLVMVGLYVLDIEYPLVLALLAAITEAIPIIGPILGSAPAILLGLLVSPALGVKVAIFYFVVQQLENHILVPKVMGGSIDLHPVLVIVSLLISGQLFGVVGMLLALPATALLKVVMHHFWTTGEE